MWECVPEGRLCLSLDGCVPLREAVHQFGRACSCISVICACVYEVWVSLSYILMTNTQVHLCVHLITGNDVAID